MASSEDEYEEVEVEEEIEVDQDRDLDENEEAEFEEVEIEVEEEEDPEEVEEDDPEEEEEEEEEDPDEEYPEEEEDIEEIDEVREEKIEECANGDGGGGDDGEDEYEEIEEEVEVTDDEAENADEQMLEAENDESTVKPSGSPLADADNRTDGVELKGDEICLGSGCKDAAMSEPTVPCRVHAVEAVESAVGSLPADRKYRKGKALLLSEVGGSRSPKPLNLVAESPVFATGLMKDKEGHIPQIIPVAASLTDEQGKIGHVIAVTALDKHAEPIIPVTACLTDEQRHVDKAASVTALEKHAISPAATDDKVGKIGSSDEGKPTFQEDSLHLKLCRDILEDQSRFSRHLTSPVRPRSLSPVAGCEVKNKRPAIVCEYFARGWCIKGSSCRFLHKRDMEESARVKEGYGQSIRTAFQPDQGSGFADASKITHNQWNDHMVNHSSGRYSSTDHGKGVIDAKLDMLEREYPPASDSQKFHSNKEGSRSHNEAENGVIRGGNLADHFHQDSPGSVGVFSNNSFPEHVSMSREISISSGSRLSYRPSPYTILEESAAMRRHYACGLQYTPFCGFQANSGSELRQHSLLHASSIRDHLPYKHKSDFIPYQWEPSVPFRSLFLSSLASMDVQYDPLRDSIEQSDILHGSFGRYSYGLTPVRGYQDNQSISGRNSGESRKNSDGGFSSKDVYGHDKDVRAGEAESAAISATGTDMNSVFKGEQPVVAASVKDVLKATRSVTDGNFMLKNDELTHKDSRVEKDVQINELDEEESKLIKYFRAALIEFVKELMKPVWHEGRLSKDVYKVIVQKAEDKILSTLPSNEVPNTSDSIKQYLSSSRSKILKLIQAYVDKYGKF